MRNEGQAWGTMVFTIPLRLFLNYLFNISQGPTWVNIVILDLSVTNGGQMNEKWDKWTLSFAWKYLKPMRLTVVITTVLCGILSAYDLLMKNEGCGRLWTQSRAKGCLGK